MAGPSGKLGTGTVNDRQLDREEVQELKKARIEISKKGAGSKQEAAPEGRVEV